MIKIKKQNNGDNKSKGNNKKSITNPKDDGKSTKSKEEKEEKLFNDTKNNNKIKTNTLADNAQASNFHGMELRKFLQDDASYWIIDKVLMSKRIEKHKYTPK